MKASKIVLYATSACLISIWAASFAISYVTLVDVALAGGLTYPWVWLFPLLLDAFMCISSLDIIRRELNGEPTRNAWVLVIGVTAVSTCFNITRADPSVLSWSVHALAPVVCFLSFEVEMGVLRSSFRQHDNIPEACEAGEAETEASEAKTIPIVKASVTSVPIVKPKPDNQNITGIISEYYRNNPTSSYAEAGKALGISRQVVRANVIKMSTPKPTVGEV